MSKNILKDTNMPLRLTIYNFSFSGVGVLPDTGIDQIPFR